MMAEAKKYNAPVTNPETAPFWEAAKAGKFMIKRCTACGEPHYFPRSICPFCFSDKTVWEESSGEGTIYTYSLMRKSPTGPYAIGYVTLKEGPSLQTNFVDCDLEKAEDRPEGESGVQADRRRAAAVLHAGLSQVPLPALRGKVARSAGRGVLSASAVFVEATPHPRSLCRTPVQPSPARGEGTSTGTAKKKKFGRKVQNADQVRTS